MSVTNRGLCVHFPVTHEETDSEEINSLPSHVSRQLKGLESGSSTKELDSLQYTGNNKKNIKYKHLYIVELSANYK